MQSKDYNILIVLRHAYKNAKKRHVYKNTTPIDQFLTCHYKFDNGQKFFFLRETMDKIYIMCYSFTSH